MCSGRDRGEWHGHQNLMVAAAAIPLLSYRMLQLLRPQAVVEESPLGSASCHNGVMMRAQSALACEYQCGCAIMQCITWTANH